MEGFVTTTTFVSFPYVVPATEGLDAPLGRLGTVHKVPAYATEGRIAIVEHRLEARRLAAPLHRHSREDELSLVLRGRMGAVLGDDVVRAEAGSYLLKPRGQWHAFWNDGDEPLHISEVLVPGGSDACFQQLSPLFRVPRIDETAIQRIASEYGIEFNFRGVDALCERFGLTFGLGASS